MNLECINEKGGQRVLSIYVKLRIIWGWSLVEIGVIYPSTGWIMLFDGFGSWGFGGFL